MIYIYHAVAKTGYWLDICRCLFHLYLDSNTQPPADEAEATIIAQRIWLDYKQLKVNHLYISFNVKY